jgi:hypothetical protein
MRFKMFNDSGSAVKYGGTKNPPVVKQLQEHQYSMLYIAEG